MWQVGTNLILHGVYYVRYTGGDSMYMSTSLLHGYYNTTIGGIQAPTDMCVIVLNIVLVPSTTGTSEFMINVDQVSILSIYLYVDARFDGRLTRGAPSAPFCLCNNLSDSRRSCESV